MPGKKGEGSREYWRLHYVESPDNVTFQDIVDKSGHGMSTIGKWSREDDRGTWKEQRDKYRRKLSEVTEQKTLEKISDRLSETYSQVQERHFKAYRVKSELAVMYFKAKVQQVIKANDKLEEFSKINPTAANFWSLILDRALKGEAASIGLPYHVNQNAAVQEVEKLGYGIVALPEGVTQDDLQNIIDNLEYET